jgi:hypothetical protein
MRQPGFEPGFEAWQASVITTTLPAQKSSMRSCKRIYIKVINATTGAFAVVWRRRARRCRGIKRAGITNIFEFDFYLYTMAAMSKINVSASCRRRPRLAAIYFYASYSSLILTKHYCAFALVHLRRSAIFSRIILTYSVRAKEPRTLEPLRTL